MIIIGTDIFNADCKRMTTINNDVKCRGLSLTVCIITAADGRE